MNDNSVKRLKNKNNNVSILSSLDEIKEKIIEKKFNSSKIVSQNELLVEACKLGRKDLCIYIIVEGGADNIGEALQYAAKSGNKELCQILFEMKYYNINSIKSESHYLENALYNSIKSRNMELFIYFEEKQISKIDYNELLYLAAQKDQLNICRYIIETQRNININGALQEACMANNKDMCIYLIDKGATNINSVLYQYASLGDIEFCKWLIDVKGANNFNIAFHAACKEGHLNLCIYLIEEKGTTWFDMAVPKAIGYGHKDLFFYLIEKKEFNNYNHALYCAALAGHKDICIFLIDEKGANNFNQALMGAISRKNEEVAIYLIGKKEDNNLIEALLAASKIGCIKICRFIFVECDVDISKETFEELYYNAAQIYNYDLKLLILEMKKNKY